MSLTLILLLLAGGLLIVPALGGDDDDDDSSSGKNEILGGPDGDTVDGTNGNDLIRTFLGDDTIDGRDGNDDIRAGEGNDFVEAGEGNDFVRGGAGDDEIFGDEGNDRIFGDRGNDFVNGGRGSDVITGGQGADALLGGVSSVLDENDLPISRSGAVDRLNGEAGDDLILAWGDGSSIQGGVVDGDEFDDMGSSKDTMVAVSGDVTMSGQGDGDTAVALANLQDDTITTASITDFDLEDDTLVLTVDHSSLADMPVDYEPDFSVTYEKLDSPTQGLGTLVTVTWDNPYGEEGETTSESAQAFLVGYPRDLEADPTIELAGLDLEIYLTEDAAYADPIATLDQIGIDTPAIAAYRAGLVT